MVGFASQPERRCPVRSSICRLLALLTVLSAAATVKAQAFRYIPPPRYVPGGGSHFPHFHLPWHSSDDFDAGMYIVIGIGVFALIVVGFCAGSGLGRRWLSATTPARC